MRNIIIIMLMGCVTTLIQAQSMKWVPMETGMATGKCSIGTKKEQLICYALQYTPAVSGVLTSYTTGFLVSCTSMGSAVAKSQSCTMTNSVRLINGCSESGVVLMNSSGNSGTSINSKIDKDIPVILHEVCFTIPYGESITIKEDITTGLTTSIDVSTGVYQTEYPTFTDITIRRDRPDVSRPFWLDFKGIPAGDFVAQLDWSTSEEVDNSHFIIERSMDGNEFAPIGRVEAVDLPGHINSYQFFDKAARLGNNYYRLQQVDVNDKVIYSPVRTVTFSESPFTVKVSPNPADKYLLVDIQSPVAESRIQLFDPAGRVVIDEKNNNKLLKTRLNIEKLIPGVYTVMVETDQDKFSEKVVIAH